MKIKLSNVFLNTCIFPDEMEHIAMNAGFAAHFSCVQSKQMKVSNFLYILIMCTIKTDESK